MSTASPSAPSVSVRPPPKTPGILYGLGLGGFLDGIVLHQILQWHHMISGVEKPTDLNALQLNTLADGFFHIATWALVLTASILTLVSWRNGRLAPSWNFHFGLALAGWGMFNVVEGLINHQLLQLHHVRDDLGGPVVWDIGFLIFGVLLIVGGWLLHRRGVRVLKSRADAV